MSAYKYRVINSLVKRLLLETNKKNFPAIAKAFTAQLNLSRYDTFLYNAMLHTALQWLRENKCYTLN